MVEVEAPQLKRAVEAQHGGTATFAQSVPVRETFKGETVWEGIVHVFDLAVPRPPGPMHGHRQLKAAPSADSSPCCIWGRSNRRRMQCGRLSWWNIVHKGIT
jgi:hypothetical protein